MVSTQVADVLDEAANIIRRNGHHKGSFCDPNAKAPHRDRACCAYGAVNLAANQRTPQKLSDIGDLAHDALCAHIGISGMEGDSLADWNDAAERTAAEVIAALEGAAAAERERAT